MNVDGVFKNIYTIIQNYISLLFPTFIDEMTSASHVSRLHVPKTAFSA